MHLDRVWLTCQGDQSDPKRFKPEFRNPAHTQRHVEGSDMARSWDPCSILHKFHKYIEACFELLDITPSQRPDNRDTEIMFSLRHSSKQTILQFHLLVHLARGHMTGDVAVEATTYR